MGGEQRAGLHRRGCFAQRVTKRQTFGQQLEQQEASVAFVEVHGRRVDAEGFEGPPSTDAEEPLLIDAVSLVAAVEPVGDLPRPAGVAGGAAIEQVQADRADLGQPNGGPYVAPRGGDGDDGAGVRQPEIGRFVDVEADRLLVVGDALGEVPVRVEEPDRHQWQTEIAGGLEVIAGEDAEAAGVLGECLGHAELGGEVGDVGGCR